MAASSRLATVSEDDFALKCFFFFFEIITGVFIVKQLFASGSVIIGEYSPRLRLGEYSPIITSPSANNKHLMTGPKGNSEFCFPETLNVPRGEAEGNIEVEGKQNSLFPEGPVIKCFVIPPNSK